MHLEQNLERALGLLECPGCHQGPLAVVGDGAAGDGGLRCAGCDQFFPYRAGILDMLGGGEQRLTLAQKSLQGMTLAKAYAWTRDPMTLLVAGYTFRREVQKMEQALDLRAGDTVLDVACGHGNFTAAIARRVAPGLVLGVDISSPMLEQALRRIHREGLRNVVLIRGDVHNLPFGSGTIPKINCSGGFCQFPHLDRAIDNIHRVLSPGGRFSGSCFARSRGSFDQRIQELVQSSIDMQFVDLVALGGRMSAAGFAAYGSARARWFGYFDARKPEVPQDKFDISTVR
jgi:ubiquinone/menaquinone biosynthesis C-methylase UbiE